MHGAVSLFNVKVGSLVGDVNGFLSLLQSSAETRRLETRRLFSPVGRSVARSIRPSVSRKPRGDCPPLLRFSPAVVTMVTLQVR